MTLWELEAPIHTVKASLAYNSPWLLELLSRLWLNLELAIFTQTQFFVYTRPVMAAQSATSETDSSEKCDVFSLRKAVKIFQTEG